MDNRPRNITMDVRMATLVGWHWNNESAWSPSGSRNARTAHDDPWWWLPWYTSDVSTACEVAEQRGLFRRYALRQAADGRFQIWRMVPNALDGFDLFVEGTSIAEAICVALLKDHEATVHQASGITYQE